MSFIEESKVFINDKVTAAFQSCKADPESVRQATAGKSLGHWRKLCITQGIGCAGGALLPGPAALAALAIEIPLLLNVFSRAALGVGWIKCGRVCYLETTKTSWRCGRAKFRWTTLCAKRCKRRPLWRSPPLPQN